jgi:1,2-diacylglycerol 3-alpha-glucosyltransferase
VTAIIWIDWYTYHIARFRALLEHRQLCGQVSGIELVGGCGVHRGLNFRQGDRDGLPITSLLPAADWYRAGKAHLALAVWRQLQQLHASTVFVPGYYTVPALVAALWARLHGKRSVLMSETTREDYRRIWWKERAKRLLVWMLFDYGIAGGKRHIRYLQQLGVRPDRIASFYDVVDNRFYEQSADEARATPARRDQLGLPRDYFLYVGRLASEKNVSGLITEFASYVHRGGTWSLVIVGDGPERPQLEQRCAILGVAPGVQFTGLKGAREIVPYYAFARCFVLPSLREPWGLVVNEAMASGLAVLVSERCGCAEDLVEAGRNGFLFNPTVHGDLADCMFRMSTLSQAALGVMGQQSRQIISGYSPEHWAAEVARIVQP